MFRVKEQPLADEIRQTRLELNLSQVALARELRVSPRTVQNWEAGTLPQLKHRQRLFDFLASAALLRAAA